ncbi:MAG: MATE family efflux transporter [Verrucomicrobia bacterium]|nr:MATE family efflux transporter [Verrucomicrobiota bacterium]
MPLTKYPEGSVRELLSVAFPLMLSSLSALFMVFVDRLFLAHYSKDAMSSAVTAGTAWWGIGGSCMILASMAEVFVAQYNGGKLYERIGRPVWQMIWLSIGSIGIMLPIACWGGLLLFYNSPNFALENEYFFWMTLFAPTWALGAALSAFWVGRGKTRMVTLMALGVNGVNIFLDWLLIFGVEGVISPMGIKGAAIATSCGSMVQVIIFFILFMRSKNRTLYRTFDYRFYWGEFWRCVRVGGPQSALFFIECVGWAYFYVFISSLGRSHIYVAGICQSVLILFFFVAEGIGRGAAALSGNFIGAKQHQTVFKVFRSGLKIHLLFFCLFAVFFAFWPDPFVKLFISDAFGKFSELSVEAQGIEQSAMVESLVMTLRICLFYLLFECVRWLISGILTAAGDTLFLLVVGVGMVPLGLLLPTYLFVNVGGGGVMGAFVIAVFYVVVVSALFYFRFAGCKWQKIALVEV